MGFTGFDSAKVNVALNAIHESYSDLHNAIKTDLQNGFIEGMSTKWACPQAQTFFANAVKPQFDELLLTINTNYAVIDEAINASAKSWAIQTGAEWTTNTATPINTSVDVTIIQESINGERGIDKEAALVEVEKLSTFAANAETALDNAKQGVIDCGLLGGQQASNLQDALDKNKSIISTYVEEVKNALNTAINDTVTAYGDTAGKISSNFAAK